MSASIFRSLANMIRRRTYIRCHKTLCAPLNRGLQYARTTACGSLVNRQAVDTLIYKTMILRRSNISLRSIPTFWDGTTQNSFGALTSPMMKVPVHKLHVSPCFPNLYLWPINMVDSLLSVFVATSGLMDSIR